MLTLIARLIGVPVQARLLGGDLPKMPTRLPSREPATAELLIRCGRYIAGIAILLVALVLFKLRLVQASHATARLGERIGGGPPVFS
jgi:hypothetical protein